MGIALLYTSRWFALSMHQNIISPFALMICTNVHGCKLRGSHHTFNLLFFVFELYFYQSCRKVAVENKNRIYLQLIKQCAKLDLKHCFYATIVEFLRQNNSKSMRDIVQYGFSCLTKKCLWNLYIFAVYMRHAN